MDRHLGGRSMAVPTDCAPCTAEHHDPPKRRRRVAGRRVRQKSPQERRHVHLAREAKARLLQGVDIAVEGVRRLEASVPVVPLLVHEALDVLAQQRLLGPRAPVRRDAPRITETYVHRPPAGHFHEPLSRQASLHPQQGRVAAKHERPTRPRCNVFLPERSSFLCIKHGDVAEVGAPTPFGQGGWHRRPIAAVPPIAGASGHYRQLVPSSPKRLSA
mmetsp:Transcript_107076/g.301332  ORF Transcript_107076/g.301332 Transcript_107076/m.301332 type:complete len:216 (-) Transcript_107076:191-838(-)